MIFFECLPNEHNDSDGKYKQVIMNVSKVTSRGQAGRQAGRQTDRQACRQTDRQAGRQAEAGRQAGQPDGQRIIILFI